jgi:hypothetical protein
MGVNMKAKRLCALAVFLFALGGIAAAQEWFSYVQQGQGEAQIFQHLSWESEEYAKAYEITVEQEQNGRYAEIIRESTETAFIEVSLGPGKYRYRIQVYDLLNLPRGNAEWDYFEVGAALQPEIQSISPEAFYLEDGAPWNIRLTGRNFTEGAEIILRARDGKGPDIIPLSAAVENEGRNITLGFDALSLSPGNYDICIRNPGGLESSAENFKIALFEKSGDINVSIGYAPLIPLYGKFFNIFDKFIDPLGAYARISVAPFKRAWGYIGAEFEPFWNFLNNSRDGYSVSSHLIGGHFNILYQRRLPNRAFVLNGRLGAGITAAIDYHYSYGDWKSFSSFFISAGAGASIQWFIRRPFFMELGIEYNHIFTTKDATHPGYLRPVLGIGVQF